MKKGAIRGWMVFALPMILSLALLVTPMAAGAKTIKIGILGPMKYVQGEDAWSGAQLALEEIEAAGGIDVGGTMMPVELVKIDTNEIASLVDATSAVERAITVDKVDFLVGGCSSGAILAMQEVAMDNKKIFLISGSGSHPEITNRVGKNYDRYKYFFRPSPINAIYISNITLNYMPDLADAIREQLGVEDVKLAMLFEQAVWVEPQIPIFKKEFPKMGIEVVGLWRMSVTAADVSSQLQAIRASGAHIILAMTSGPAAIPLYRQIGELEIPAFVTGVNVEAEGAEFFQATGGMCVYGGVSATFGKVAMSHRTLPFYERFEEKYNRRPTLTAIAYDSTLILKEAIERAGSLDSDKVVVELEKTDYPSIAGRIVFDKNHDVKFGPGYQVGLGSQWMPDGTMQAWWPNGWKGMTYEGVEEVQFSPWMVEHWTGKKK